MTRQTKSRAKRRVDAYPLSPLQQGMLYHTLAGREPGVDVEQVYCELGGPPDAAVLAEAWRIVVERHEILRTCFDWPAGGEPRQMVLPASEVNCAVREISWGAGVPDGPGSYLEADRRESFDLAVAPPWRLALVQPAEGRRWLVFTFHHVLLDGRALAAVLRETFDLADALAAGGQPAPAPAHRYRDYIDWLQALDWTRAEKYWREQLRGFTQATPLPFPPPADALAVAAGTELRHEVELRFDAAATARLHAAARRHDVTLNTLVQAAWAVTLGRHGGERDVVFGAVRACRHIPIEGAGSTVGLFINTVPVRVRLEPDGELGPWLQDLREQWLALRDHEHAPLAKVQQWSEVPAGQPLFETLVNFQEPSWDAALRALGGKWLDRRFAIRSQPNFPLAVDAYGGAELVIKLLHDRRRVADEAAVRLLGHYRTVLEAMTDDAPPRLGDLPLLTPAETRQVLVEWNHTTEEFPRARCVHQFFEARAKDAPGRLAVADAGARLTYGELNRRANQLAHRLKSFGVGPEVPVAVCLERSVEMIVAWLGIVKAGGAWVPLDPEYPAARLAFQLRDCRAPVVLTQPRFCAVLAAAADATVLTITAAGGEFRDEPEGNLAVVTTARNLAYVIYTSGSTGEPKGVEVEHRALLNLVTWHRRTYRVTADDRASQLASPAFDAAIWEIWPYLAAGASVHIVDAETRLAPAALVTWLGQNEITLAFLPTPLAEAVMEESWPAGTRLRALLTGGDRLQRRPPAEFPCAVINHYGPTEGTVVATSSTVAPHGPALLTPAIGRPIANTRAYVLDARGRPVPAGVAGELFIGGEGLARGYLGRPELTAEKFVPDPFHPTRDARLYRTGDLVRWRADGELEFIGRRDEQVKIRGCRVEPAEIETALNAHPAVRESLVVACDGPAGQRRLAGYALARAGAARPTRAELEGFLRKSLPAHMVPSAFVWLAAWPLTPNGKIDRRALPSPASGPETDPAFTAPRKRLEQTVARIWMEVLGRGAIGVEDGFFALGGHSLLAARVIARLHAAGHPAASVRLLFDHPTLGEFARALADLIPTGDRPRPPVRLFKRHHAAARPVLARAG